MVEMKDLLQFGHNSLALVLADNPLPPQVTGTMLGHIMVTELCSCCRTSVLT